MVAVSLGATQRRSKGPVERTVTEYERPFPTLYYLFAIRGEYVVGLVEGEEIV